MVNEGVTKNHPYTKSPNHSSPTFKTPQPPSPNDSLFVSSPMGEYTRAPSRDGLQGF